MPLASKKTIMRIFAGDKVEVAHGRRGQAGRREPIEPPLWVTDKRHPPTRRARSKDATYDIPQEPAAYDDRRDETSSANGLQDPPQLPPRHLHAEILEEDGQGPGKSRKESSRSRARRRREACLIDAIHYGTPRCRSRVTDGE